MVGKEVGVPFLRREFYCGCTESSSEEQLRAKLFFSPPSCSSPTPTPQPSGRCVRGPRCCTPPPASPRAAAAPQCPPRPSRAPARGGRSAPKLHALALFKWSSGFTVQHGGARGPHALGVPGPDPERHLVIADRARGPHGLDEAGPAWQSSHVGAVRARGPHGIGVPAPSRPFFQHCTGREGARHPGAERSPARGGGAAGPGGGATRRPHGPGRTPLGPTRRAGPGRGGSDGPGGGTRG